jgi:hypothetical protein
MPSEKITRALATQIRRASGGPVKGVVFVAIDGDTLTLSSFAARAAERDRTIRERFARVAALVQEWEARSGRQAELAFRPDQAAASVTGPADLFEALAGDEAVAAVDVDVAAT